MWAAASRGRKHVLQGAESAYQGANRVGSVCDNHIKSLTICEKNDMWGGNSPERKMSETKREYAANYIVHHLST